MDNLLKNALLVVALLSPFSNAIAEPYQYVTTTELPLIEVYRNYAFGKVPSEEWAALDELIGYESGWNPEAQNPVSSAYGIFQFLDSTWATVGCEKTSAPRQQIDCGILYIEKNYGSPKEALRQWKRRLVTEGHGWY